MRAFLRLSAILMGLFALQAGYAANSSPPPAMPFLCTTASNNIYDSLARKIGRQPTRADREKVLSLAIQNGVPEPEVPRSYYGYNYYQLAGALTTDGNYIAARNLLAALSESPSATISATMAGLNKAYPANSQIDALRQQAITIFGASYFNNPNIRIFIDGTLYGDQLAIETGKELICNMKIVSMNSVNDNEDAAAKAVWQDMIRRVRLFYFSVGLGPDPRRPAADDAIPQSITQQPGIFSSIIPAISATIQSVVSSLIDAFTGMIDTLVMKKSAMQISAQLDKAGLVNAKSAEVIATQKTSYRFAVDAAEVKHNSESGSDNACAAMETSGQANGKVESARRTLITESKSWSRTVNMGGNIKTTAILYEKGLGRYATAADVERYRISKATIDIPGGDIDANLMYNDRGTGGESYDGEQKKAIEDGIALKTLLSAPPRASLAGDNSTAAMQHGENTRTYSAYMSGAQSSYNFVKNQHLKR